jgi:hypothetical protein
MNNLLSTSSQCGAVLDIISSYANYVRCSGTCNMIFEKPSNNPWQPLNVYHFNQIHIDPKTKIIYANDLQFKIVHATDGQNYKLIEIDDVKRNDDPQQISTDFKNPTTILFDETSFFNCDELSSEIHVWDVCGNMTAVFSVFIESMTPARCLFFGGRLFVLYWSDQEDESNWDWEIHIFNNYSNYVGMFCHCPPKTECCDILHFTADRFGNVFVSDVGTQRVDKFSPEGDHIGFLLIYAPTHVLTSKLDELFVVLSLVEGIQTIMVFDLNFNFRRSFQLKKQNLLSMAMLPDGEIITGGETSLVIYK